MGGVDLPRIDRALWREESLPLWPRTPNSSADLWRPQAACRDRMRRPEGTTPRMPAPASRSTIRLSLPAIRRTVPATPATNTRLKRFVGGDCLPARRTQPCVHDEPYHAAEKCRCGQFPYRGQAFHEVRNVSADPLTLRRSTANCSRPTARTPRPRGAAITRMVWWFARLKPNRNKRHIEKSAPVRLNRPTQRICRR